MRMDSMNIRGLLNPSDWQFEVMELLNQNFPSANAASPYLSLLRNHIDITRVPFSDRGSRLLVFRQAEESRLMVKLAERLTGLDPDIEAYLRRPPFIRDLTFIDENGEALEYELMTRPHILYFRTRLGEFGLVFQDRRTLAFGLPTDATAGIRFHVYPQYWHLGNAGGAFKAVRNLTYTTNGACVCNRITPLEGGYQVEFIVQGGSDTTIALTIHPETAIGSEAMPFSLAHTAAETRWQDWFSRVPEVAEPYRRTYAYAWWVMANNLISPQGKVTYESMAPSKVSYVGLWLWDNAMHSLAFRHIDPDLARNQIRAMLAHQLPNGMLPDAVYDEGVVATIDHPIIGEVTKPPILAWAALKLHEMDPDLKFLDEIYMPLVRLNSWWFTMNDDDGDGLSQYNHPYSSGLDDSPLWDEGMPVESPDLNTYLCIQMGSLAVISEYLGLEMESQMWRRRAASIVNRMIQDFWDEQAGLFWALKDGQPIRVVTPFNLFPLWTGQLPEHIKRRLIEHLTNPEEFWGDFVIPTVARNDPKYDPCCMWRGPVWANINYFFIEALEQVHEFDLARELRRKTLDLIMQHNTIYEYYNSESGEAPGTAADIFGWTAAVFIDLAIKASRQEEAEA
jgi:glycogen debranching enzyme